jgi:hypothetical protein
MLAASANSTSRILGVGELRRDAGAALDEHAAPERLQLGGNLPGRWRRGFIGSGLLEDTDDDRHAGYLP